MRQAYFSGFLLISFLGFPPMASSNVSLDTSDRDMKSKQPVLVSQTSNPEVPAYPEQPGPDVIRPEFDNPDILPQPNLPITGQPLPPRNPQRPTANGVTNQELIDIHRRATGPASSQPAGLPAANGVTSQELMDIHRRATGQASSQPAGLPAASGVTKDQLREIEEATKTPSGQSTGVPTVNGGTKEELMKIRSEAVRLGAEAAKKKAQCPSTFETLTETAVESIEKADICIGYALMLRLSLSQLGVADRAMEAAKFEASAINRLQQALIHARNESDRIQLQRKLQEYRMIPQSEEKMDETNERLRKLMR